ncbi:MAG: DUF3617 domain-containing protein [Sphingobium sp.]
MRHMVLMLACAITLLAACGEKSDQPVDPSTGPQSKEEVKAQAAKVKLRPGQWQNSFTLEDLEMEGLPGGAPPQMKEQMKSAMTRTDMKYCVTKEEAENPDGKMFSGQEAKHCTYSGFDASDGALTGQISCKTQGGTMTAVMSGSYSPESYEMHMDMKTQGGPQGTSMKMKARTDGKWIGPDCA